MSKRSKAWVSKAAKASPLDGLIIGLADAARLIGKSETWVLRLVKDGHLQKVRAGKYCPEEVAQAALRFREADDRRSSQTEEAKRVQAARAREIELRIAREEGRLVRLDDVNAAVADILGTYRSELEGVAAAVTRDLAIRTAIQTHFEQAIDRARARFERASAALRAGDEVEMVDE
jgi:hypothetical protein